VNLPESDEDELCEGKLVFEVAVTEMGTMERPVGEDSAVADTSEAPSVRLKLLEKDSVPSVDVPASTVLEDPRVVADDEGTKGTVIASFCTLVPAGYSEVEFRKLLGRCLQKSVNTYG
jgi:hypothetical protein